MLNSMGGEREVDSGIQVQEVLTLTSIYLHGIIANTYTRQKMNNVIIAMLLKTGLNNLYWYI